MVECIPDKEDDDIAEEIEIADIFDDTESDNPMFAVEDAIDTYGSFGRNKDGTLCFEDFLVLKEIIHR